MTTTISILKSDFAGGVKMAKRYGGKYNPTTKTWDIPNCNITGDLDARRANLLGWKIVSTAVTTPATTWMGNSSMDAEDSIY